MSIYAIILAVVGVGFILLWLSSGDEPESATQDLKSEPPAPTPSADASAELETGAAKEEDSSTAPAEEAAGGEVPDSEKPTEVDEDQASNEPSTNEVSGEEEGASDEDEPTADSDEPTADAEESSDETGSEAVDLEKCTVAELKAMAKEKGLTGISRLKKGELIAKLRGA